VTCPIQLELSIMKVNTLRPGRSRPTRWPATSALTLCAPRLKLAPVYTRFYRFGTDHDVPVLAGSSSCWC
jgi:hypothetical protein